MVKLIDAAAAAFVEHGFQRTQMDDIAERLGVSKGTIYRAVESKGALFAAVIARGDTPAQGLGDAGTPTDDVTSLAATVSTQLAEAVAALELHDDRLATHPPPGERVRRRGRTHHQRPAPGDAEPTNAIMVLDRCLTGEIPELATIWFGDGRYALVDLWHEYLTLRSTHLTIEVDPAILARHRRTDHHLGRQDPLGSSTTPVPQRHCTRLRGDDPQPRRRDPTMTTTTTKRPGLVGRFPVPPVGHPTGVVGRIFRRAMVKDTAAANDRAVELLDLCE